MHLFYLPEIDKKFYHLNQEESRHCIKSLRLKCGDSVFFTNGRGDLAEGKIVDDNIKNCRIEIVKKVSVPEVKDYKLHIAIAPTKSPDRFEWFLEKATEIGIDEITPLITKYAERGSINTERSQRIIQSAMKQSLRFHLPVINSITDFETFINKSFTCNRYIAHCHLDNIPHLKDVYIPDSDLVILIGPEGDFSETEVKNALKKNFKEISLGKNRLRTETAGIVCCSLINLLNLK